MSRSYRILFSSIAIVIILACNIQSVQGPPAAPDYVATITAQAALLIQPTANNQPSPQPDVISATPEIPAPAEINFTETPSPTATNTLTATIAFTSTSSIPMLTVSANTNCRSGPGKDYDYLGALLINQSAEIVGKNTSTGYWIIKNPERAGTCWLWGNYAIISGDVSKLQEYAIPPTPTPSMPEAPKGLKANKICFNNGVTFNLSGSISWEDGPNEAGYNVYLNGGLFNVIPVNGIISALPNIVLAPGGSIKMSVEAFNSAGKSAKKSVNIVCP